MLKMFYLDVLKINRDIVQRRWLMDSGLLQPSIAAAGA
jgi:hypothetical protein